MFSVPADETVYVAVELDSGDRIAVFDGVGRKVDVAFSGSGLRTIISVAHLVPSHYTFLVQAKNGTRKGRGSFIIGPK